MKASGGAECAQGRGPGMNCRQPRYPGKSPRGPEVLRPRLTTGVPLSAVGLRPRSDVRVVRSATHHSLREPSAGMVRERVICVASELSRVVQRRQPRLCRHLGTINRCCIRASTSRMRKIQALSSLGRRLTSSGARSTVRALSWGHSSAGRALAWHARGRRFDPVWLHQIRSGSTAIERGSIQSPSSRGLGHNPFTVATGVRIPVGTPRPRRPAPSGDV